MKDNIRLENLLLSPFNRSLSARFERQQVAKAFMDFKWDKHIAMGCDASRTGHQEDISALDLDNEEKLLMFGSFEGVISIVKCKNLYRQKWRKPMNFNLRPQSLRTLKWCPLDNRMFMMGTTGGWMRVCDTTRGTEIHSKKFDDGDVYFDWNEYNMTNPRVAVGDGSASLKVIDFRVGMSLPQSIRWRGSQNPIDVVQWFPSKQHYLYAGRRDGKVGIFDIRSTRGVLKEKQMHKAPLHGIRLTPDGRRLITLDYAANVRVSDTWCPT
ncbi:unnamed protein product [Caenorhabditis sp. 36 PRJEB53466]|nr:unnamed protein product [Caenorhabditis sp. 36 PRJEB53466]